MYLTYENLTVRNAEASDCETLCRWWNDGSVMAHAGFPLGLGTTAEKIAGQIKTDTDNTQRRLIIEIDGAAAGEMSYSVTENSATASLGIKICDATQQNKGYGKKLLSMVISSLFGDLGISKIVLDTNLDNLRAQHVYESLGFKKLRVNIDCWKNQLGQIQSTVDYELTPENFKSYI